MKLSKIHLARPAFIDGSPRSMLTVDEGWTIELRPDLGGVIAGRKNRDDAAKVDQVWIPLANCANGFPVEVPSKAGK